MIGIGLCGPRALKLFFKGVELTINDCQALNRLEELAVGKDESVVEISNVEAPRSQNPIEIQIENFSPNFSGKSCTNFRDIIG